MGYAVANIYNISKKYLDEGNEYCTLFVDKKNILSKRVYLCVLQHLKIITFSPLFNLKWHCSIKKAPEIRGLKLMQIGEEFPAALVQKAFPALIKLLLKYAACLHLQQDTPERYILVLE